MALLELRDVTMTFGEGEQRVEALRGISFDVDPGEMIALVGPSGSGKSTALAIIGGLLTPTGGEVRIDGDDIARLSGRARTRYRRDRIGFVFQGSNVIPFLTARENLLLVGDFGGINRRLLRERAGELLGELGLEDAADQLASQLSGGQRQRVAIARALVRDPALLLVDEPTASLDTPRGIRVVESLRDETHRRGKACLMVTHDMEMASRADRILEIRDGLLTEHATA